MTLLEMLLSTLSPSSAEAKIRGTPEAMDLVSDLIADAEKRRTSKVQTFGGKELPPVTNYLPDMYSRIYRTAETRPEEVYISPVKDMEYERGASGEYKRPPSGPFGLVTGGKHRIEYDPKPGGGFENSLPNTIPHELLHFLDYTSGRRQSPIVQHDLIYQLIGGDLTGPRVTGIIPGAPPVAMTPMQRAILERWFGQKETER